MRQRPIGADCLFFVALSRAKESVGTVSPLNATERDEALAAAGIASNRR